MKLKLLMGIFLGMTLWGACGSEEESDSEVDGQAKKCESNSDCPEGEVCSGSGLNIPPGWCYEPFDGGIAVDDGDTRVTQQVSSR